MRDGNSYYGVEPPYAITRHCAVVFQDKIWIIGGLIKNEEEVSYQTQILDNYYDYWYEGPELIYGRWGHSCVVTESRFYNNAEVIVIAGGFGEYDGLIDSVEFMYDFKWSRGTYCLKKLI